MAQPGWTCLRTDLRENRLGGSVFVGGSDLVSSCFFLVLVRWPRHDGEKIL